VLAESILKKQHLQNRCHRHIGGGQQQSVDAEDRNVYFIVAAAIIAVYS